MTTLEMQPIESAPLNGGWILGYEPALKATSWSSAPWVIVTRCDSGSGWSDIDGNGLNPTHWAPLPDPQPEPTKWLPAEGTIRVVEVGADGWTDGKGKPVAVSWRWMVDIERPDGSFDEYRDCDFRETLEQAQAAADRWAKQYGLPVVTVPLDRKVIPFQPRGGRR